MERITKFTAIFWVRSYNGTHSKVFYDLCEAMSHFNWVKDRCDKGAIISKTQAFYDDCNWERLFESS